MGKGLPSLEERARMREERLAPYRGREDRPDPFAGMSLSDVQAEFKAGGKQRFTYGSDGRKSWTPLFRRLMNASDAKNRAIEQYPGGYAAYHAAGAPGFIEGSNNTFTIRGQGPAGSLETQAQDSNGFSPISGGSTTGPDGTQYNLLEPGGQEAYDAAYRATNTPAPAGPMGSLSDFMESARILLKDGGAVYAIYPAKRGTELLFQMRRASLEPKKIRMVHSRLSSDAEFILVEGVKRGGEELTIMAPLFIYGENSRYSLEMAGIFNEIACPGGFGD